MAFTFDLGSIDFDLVKQICDNHSDSALSGTVPFWFLNLIFFLEFWRLMKWPRLECGILLIYSLNIYADELIKRIWPIICFSIDLSETWSCDYSLFVFIIRSVHWLFYKSMKLAKHACFDGLGSVYSGKVYLYTAFQHFCPRQGGACPCPFNLLMIDWLVSWLADCK